MNQKLPRETIAVVGSGYLGTVVAACFAWIGHRVVAVESDPRKLKQLGAARAPFPEPGLDELLAGTLDSGDLVFTDDLAAATRESNIVFLCVGTPAGPGGEVDLSAIATAARVVGKHSHTGLIIVTKSTVPVGTGRWLQSLIEDQLAAVGKSSEFSIVSNPEFLREGSAVQDFLHPDRVVVGGDDENACQRVIDLHQPIIDPRSSGAIAKGEPVPVIRTSLATAEMTKYASNSFLATKLSFANELSRVCERVGADITEVIATIGLDARIGSNYFDAGIGWGGSCLGKDLLALIHTAQEYCFEPELLRAVVSVNDSQRQLVVDELLRHLKVLRGARICIFGLAFKSGTDDLRDSPGVDIARRLIDRGAFVTAYDPMVGVIPDDPTIRTLSGPFEAASGADAVVITTDSPQFLTIDLAKLRRITRGDVFFDGRNVFNPRAVQAAGFRYIGIGRPMTDGFATVSLRRNDELDASRSGAETVVSSAATVERLTGSDL